MPLMGRDFCNRVTVKRKLHSQISGPLSIFGCSLYRGKKIFFFLEIFVYFKVKNAILILTVKNLFPVSNFHNVVQTSTWSNEAMKGLSFRPPSILMA